MRLSKNLENVKMLSEFNKSLNEYCIHLSYH